MAHLSTGSVAELLGVATHRIEYLLRDRQIRPGKGPTGAFLWAYDDVKKLASLLGTPSPSEHEFRKALARVDTGGGSLPVRPEVSV